MADVVLLQHLGQVFDLDPYRQVHDTVGHGLRTHERVAVVNEEVKLKRGRGS